jgi:hypothetical protein
MKYRGSCHCGKVAIEVDGQIDKGLACNCSICSRKGSLLWFVPRAQARVLGDEQDIASYQFNKGIIEHRFCKTCGVQPFAFGKDRQGNEIAAINLRCIEGIDLDKIPVTHFDGKSL